MKKVLITGSSGYIGSHLCKMLAEKYIVQGLDIKQKDIAHNEIIDDEYDCVVHLASYFSGSQSTFNPSLCYTFNVTGTINLLNTIKTKNIIFTSSGQTSLYANPLSISKQAIEDCVVEYCNKNKRTSYTIFRIHYVLGGDIVKFGNTYGLMASLINAVNTGQFTIHGDDYNTADGTCIRDYVHVNEICHAIAQAIEEPANGMEELGHGSGKSIKEIVKLFKSVNNVNFNTILGSRLAGEPAEVVCKKPSRYLKKMYEIEDLLKISE